MTAQWIEVDGEVIGVIKNAAEPFVDNPNAVLRRLLGLPRSDDDRTAPLPQSAPRAPKELLLPLPDFELPILCAVLEAGGSASRSAVLDAVGVALGDRLTNLDRERLTSGRVRWHTRVDQVRNRLVKRGLLESSHRGMWKLTETGTKHLNRRLESRAAAERRAAK